MTSIHRILGSQFGAGVAGLLLLAASDALAMGKGLSSHPGESRWVEVGPRRVLLAAGIPEGAQLLLQRDFAAIEKLDFADPDPELVKVMELREASRAELTRWLGVRLGYLIAEDEELVPVFGPMAAYPFADELPDAGGDSGFGAQLEMNNDGVELYARAKKRKRKVSVELPGVGVLDIDSPRIGLLRIGPALFSPEYFYRRDRFAIAPDSRLASFKRISILFHEARHTDGHGRSLGFSHALCPDGHALKGVYACDRSLNGAYAVGALMAGAMLESCRDCDAREREVMSVLASDSWDRVLVNEGAVEAKSGAAYWDAEPESL